MSTRFADVCDVLREPRRHRLLRRLRDAEGERQEAVLGHRAEIEQLRARHVDLPKLAEAGYVDWEREQGTVSKGPRFEEIVAVLDLFDDHAEELPFSWPRVGTGTERYDTDGTGAGSPR